MASRKEQKEQLRQERMEREQAAASASARKRLMGIVVAAILALAIVGAIAVVALSGGDDDGGSGKGGDSSQNADFPDGGSVPEQKEADLKKAIAAAGCAEETIKAEGAGDHSTDPNEVIKYKTEPPALGRHFQEWPDDDIYEEAPRLSHVVHTLEHGRVLIWVKPSAPEELRSQVRALYDEDPYHVIVVPRKELKEPIAVSAWVGQNSGRILRCPTPNEQIWDAIRVFKETYRDKAPEFVP